MIGTFLHFQTSPATSILNQIAPNFLTKKFNYQRHYMRSGNLTSVLVRILDPPYLTFRTVTFPHFSNFSNLFSELVGSILNQFEWNLHQSIWKKIIFALIPLIWRNLLRSRNLVNFQQMFLKWAARLEWMSSSFVLSFGFILETPSQFCFENKCSNSHIFFKECLNVVHVP